jgi:hypothetical protein
VIQAAGALPFTAMAGRDERQGPDVDDWFDEPQPPRARRVRPRGDDAASAPPRQSEDDWLGEGNARTPRRPPAGLLANLSDRGRAIAIGVVLVVLLLIGLAVGGVFSGSKPRPALSLTLTHPAGATTARTATTTTNTVAVPSGPLKPGDTGAQVKVLQRALTKLGFSPGPADGDYGTSTKNAVIRFQQASHLTADGVAGSKTLQALRTALANQ